MNNSDVSRIKNSPEFQSLLSERRKLSIPISLTIIVSYFGFVLLVAFDPALLGKTFGDSHVSIGIYAGLLLLLLSFALTVIYVRVSDGKIAELQKKIQNNS